MAEGDKAVAAPAAPKSNEVESMIDTLNLLNKNIQVKFGDKGKRTGPAINYISAAIVQLTRFNEERKAEAEAAKAKS